jgi:AbrB family looped-hinge helix DNA binding protein
MTTTVTIDKAGRVVLPKPFRAELGLQAGDTLELVREGERLTLRPIRGRAPLKKEHGVWVFHGGSPVSARMTDEVLVRERSRRDRRILDGSE